MKKMMKNVAVAVLTFMLGSMTNISEAAGIPLFDKFGEKIGMGPSKTRINRRLEPGKPRILANGQKYQIIDANWGYARAKTYAETQLGHLAIIDTAYENRLLYEFMIAQGYKAAYFGLADVRFDGDWRYTNGKSPKYTKWHREQPKRDDKLLKYAMLYSIYTDGSWKAGTFSTLAKVKGGTAFIIEWDAIYTPQQAAEFNSGKPVTIYPNGNPNENKLQQPINSGSEGRYWYPAENTSVAREEEEESFEG